MTRRDASAPRWLEALARRAVTQPIAVPVPADDARFLATKGAAKLAWRVLRRRGEMRLSGQRRLQVEHIDPTWRRAIWFHAEAPQIGDALMDLAPRSLLAERGIVVDLVAPPTIAALFRGDRLLGRVAADAGEIDAASCDFAIVDSDSWKALAGKRRHAPGLPWLSMHGEYLAYDFHRGLFGTRRLAALLGVGLDARAERLHARQKLVLGDQPSPTGDATGRIVIAVGGVRPERSYRHWAAVASSLARHGQTRFTLVGSDNGRAVADEIRAALSSADVLDQVGRIDLHATRRLIAGAALALCADGGLLHLACTTTTPLVALFDASIDPAWRLPLDLDGAALRSPVRDVSTIEPDAVVAQALECLAAASPRPGGR